MPKFIPHPVSFRDAAVRGDEIREYIGRIGSGDDEISVGLLSFPEGWSEPPQRPEFDEYTVVLDGALYVDTETVGTVIVRAGQGILVPRGERIRYRTPKPGGAEYLAVCVPAFTPERAHREPEGSTIPTTRGPNWKAPSPIKLTRRPTVLQGTGLNARQIEEFFGNFVGNTDQVSIARARSFEGCTAEFRRVSVAQYVVVRKGELQVNFKSVGTCHVGADQAIVAEGDQWFQFLTPAPGETVYFLVCLPARGFDYETDENASDVFMT